ncbi:MAG: hypothetical protein OIF50_09110 [Flavobacteriaceae bacterium]|nr:hypothetical protein [Flavobacteriaceae bacterium]
MPKHKKFKYQDAPYTLKSTDFINTEAIYVSMDTFKYGDNQEYQKLHFYKFYSNGRYHEGTVNAFENDSIKQFNKKTILGYYRIDKDTLKLEGFFVREKERGDFIFGLALIKEKELSFISQENKGFVKYASKKTKGLNQKADW